MLYVLHVDCHRTVSISRCSNLPLYWPKQLRFTVLEALLISFGLMIFGNHISCAVSLKCYHCIFVTHSHPVPHIVVWYWMCAVFVVCEHTTLHY